MERNGMNAPFDAEKSKAATREQWDKHAKGWNDHSVQIGDWLRESTDAMLAMAEVGPGARVLDVAAGAGDQTLDIAERVGPTGSVSVLGSQSTCDQRSSQSSLARSPWR
jgi:ubiquinone/menaquinone biosynthesis C-methylase UbiE